MTNRYRTVPLDIRERRWRVYDLDARTGRGKFTGRCYRWPFARLRAGRRARKLNGG